jgi:hypothetical protein
MTEFERNFYTLPKIGAISMATFAVTNTNDSGAGSLRQAITSADASTGNNIINFSGLFDDGLAHTISLTGGGLSITDDISIQGRNPNLLTISDDSASRVFDITSGATATINGLTITNTYNSAGGGGGISNEGVLTLNNSIITGNTAYGNIPNPTSILDEGGGIYNTGNLTINHSIISNNFATGLYLSDGGDGGGIYNGGSLTVNYSNITGNSAFFFVGGIENTGTLTVNYSTIDGNTGGDDSGGIGNGGTLTVNYSSITDNKGFIGGIGNGGTLAVNYSSITDNQANSSGGGIDNNNGSVTVNYSNITDNTAGGVGGGIISSRSLTVNYSSITDNQANFGGGIYNTNGTLTLNYSNITGNTANNRNSAYGEYGEGGGIFNGDAGSTTTATVNYSNISGNTAGTAGGGIYNDSLGKQGLELGIVTVSDSTISGNQAHFGGGIYNDGILTVGNSAIYNNSAFGIQLSSGVYQSGDGGGIYNNSTYGTTTVDYSTIAFNFDTCQEYSNYRISPDDIAGNFINNGYNWIGTTTSTTAAGDAA